MIEINSKQAVERFPMFLKKCFSSAWRLYDSSVFSLETVKKWKQTFKIFIQVFHVCYMTHKVFSGPSEIIPLAKSHHVFGKSNMQHNPSKEALKKTALYCVITKRALMSLNDHHETVQNAVCIWQLPCYMLNNNLKWLVEILQALGAPSSALLELKLPSSCPSISSY